VSDQTEITWEAVRTTIKDGHIDWRQLMSEDDLYVMKGAAVVPDGRLERLSKILDAICGAVKFHDEKGQQS